MVLGICAQNISELSAKKFRAYACTREFREHMQSARNIQTEVGAHIIQHKFSEYNKVLEMIAQGCVDQFGKHTIVAWINIPTKQIFRALWCSINTVYFVATACLLLYVYISKI